LATSTFQVLRRGLAHYLGYGEFLGKDLSAWTTTTDVGDSALVISTELRDAGLDDLGEGGSGDDWLEHLWLILLGTENLQAVRRAKSYDASAGQITVAGTDLTAESGATDFELHKYHPMLLRDCLNVARLKAFPALYRPLRSTLFTARGQYRYEIPSTIINSPTAIYLEEPLAITYANNILSNAGFEDWTSGSPDSWTAAAGITTTEETATTATKNYMVLEGENSVRLTNGSTGTARTFDQTISSPDTHSGQRISLYIWVHCLEANTVNTAITIGSTKNSGVAADGGVHGGTGWELLTHYEDAAITLSTLKIGLEFASGAATGLEVYVENVIAVVGPLQEPENPGMELRNWEYIPVMEGSTLRNQVLFPYDFADLQRLRIVGQGYLSSVSAETDTMEVGNAEVELLYAYASVELYQRYIQLTPNERGVPENLRHRNAMVDIQRLSHATMGGRKRKLQIPDWGM
jgi:hypothetical protein